MKIAAMNTWYGMWHLSERDFQNHMHTQDFTMQGIQRGGSRIIQKRVESGGLGDEVPRS